MIKLKFAIIQNRKKKIEGCERKSCFSFSSCQKIESKNLSSKISNERRSVVVLKCQFIKIYVAQYFQIIRRQ